MLVHRLAAHGLLEYRLARSRRAEDLVVIEPQVSDYWPRMPQLGNADKLVLSRFAYMRRRGDAMVLESPRAGALFRICDPKLVTLVATLSTPQQVKELRLQDGFPGIAFLALLVDCQMLVQDRMPRRRRPAFGEGDDDLVLWEFHDLCSTRAARKGRHANPLGGVYPYAGVIPPLPAVRPRWPGKQDRPRASSQSEAAQAARLSPVAKLLRERHSTRSFDDQRPITLAELSRFLDGTARVAGEIEDSRPGTAIPTVDYAPGHILRRAQPTSSSSIWPSTHAKGCARGFYHYDAGAPRAGADRRRARASSTRC